MSEPSDLVPQRIGDAERDEAATYLREALAQGRLDADEFDERLDRALRAKTAADLDPLFQDLPGPKPGQAVSPSASFQAPPWQQAAKAPSSEVAPSAPKQVAKSTDTNRALDIIAWAAWPVTIIALFATHWDHWWLIFIPIFISSFVGSQHGRHRRHQDGHS